MSVLGPIGYLELMQITHARDNFVLFGRGLLATIGMVSTLIRPLRTAEVTAPNCVRNPPQEAAEASQPGVLDASNARVE